MPAPPVDPLVSRRPLLTVSESRLRLPEPATSKIRKVGVPEAEERAIVAPLPAMVTVPVITGSPVPPPPSVELLAAVSVYVHPLASVTLPPPETAATALISADVEQAMGAAAAVSGVAMRVADSAT